MRGSESKRETLRRPAALGVQPGWLAQLGMGMAPSFDQVAFRVGCVAGFAAQGDGARAHAGCNKSCNCGRPCAAGVEVRIDWYVLVPALLASSKDVDVNR